MAYGRNHGTTVRVRSDEDTRVDVSRLREPHLHLDLVPSSNPVDFYDILVDLYILSLGRCVTQSRGGFGRLAYLLSGHDMDCRRLTKFMGVCHEDKFWGDVAEDIAAGSTGRLPSRLFLPPMEDE